MKKLVIAMTVVLIQPALAQDILGCTKPQHLPVACAELKTGKDVDRCIDNIFMRESEIVEWEKCAIQAIRKEQDEKIDRIIDSANSIRQSRMSFIQTDRTLK